MLENVIKNMVVVVFIIEDFINVLFLLYIMFEFYMFLNFILIIILFIIRRGDDVLNFKR